MSDSKRAGNNRTAAADAIRTAASGRESNDTTSVHVLADGKEAGEPSPQQKKKLVELKEERNKQQKRAKWMKKAKKRAREDLKKELLVMQGYAITFDSVVFVKMLIYHLAFPFSLPVVYWVEGMKMCKNVGFTLRKPGHVFFGLIPNLTVQLCVFLYFFQPTEEFRQVCGGVEIAAFAIIFLIQRLTIATKYAYMPAEQFQQYSCRLLSPAEIDNVELGTGWMRMPPLIVKQGIENAAMRIGTDATKRYFVFEDREIERVRDMLRTAAPGCDHKASVKDLVEDCFLWGQSWELAMTTNRVSVPLFCMYLALVLEENARREINMIYRMGWPVLAILHAAMPFVTRFIDGRPLIGTHPTTIIAAIGLSLFSATFLAVIIMFLYVGVLDYWRRYAYMRRVGALLKPSLKDPAAGYDIPVVSLRVPSNYRSWLIARRVMLNFGLEYWRRIQLNSTFMASVIAVVLVWTGYALLDNKLNASLLTFAFIDSWVVVSVLLPMLHYGSLANGTTHSHISIFLEAQVDLRDELAGMPPEARGMAGLGEERTTSAGGPRFMAGMRAVPMSADGGSSSSLSGARDHRATRRRAAHESHVVTDALGPAAHAQPPRPASAAADGREQGGGSSAHSPRLRHAASTTDRRSPAGTKAPGRLTHSVPLPPPRPGRQLARNSDADADADTTLPQPPTDSPKGHMAPATATAEASAAFATVLEAARASGVDAATLESAARHASIMPATHSTAIQSAREASTWGASAENPVSTSQGTATTPSAGSKFIPAAPPTPGKPQRQRTAEGGVLEVDSRFASARLLAQCDSLCLAIVYGLKSDTATRPIRLLGVTASGVALRSVVVVAASIASLMWGLYNAR